MCARTWWPCTAGTALSGQCLPMASLHLAAPWPLHVDGCVIWKRKSADPLRCDHENASAVCVCRSAVFRPSGRPRWTPYGSTTTRLIPQRWRAYCGCAALITHGNTSFGMICSCFGSGLHVVDCALCFAGAGSCLALFLFALLFPGTCCTVAHALMRAQSCGGSFTGGGGASALSATFSAQPAIIQSRAIRAAA